MQQLSCNNLPHAKIQQFPACFKILKGLKTVLLCIYVSNATAIQNLKFLLRTISYKSLFQGLLDSLYAIKISLYAFRKILSFLNFCLFIYLFTNFEKNSKYLNFLNNLYVKYQHSSRNSITKMSVLKWVLLLHHFKFCIL